MSSATSIDSARDRRWLVLGVIGLAQLMVVLDLTVMNVALPSAQRALGFTTVDRQWVRSEEHTSELQSPDHLVCRLLLEKKKKQIICRRMTWHNIAYSTHIQ